jgi:hypothetical protein
MEEVLVVLVVVVEALLLPAAGLPLLPLPLCGTCSR